MKHATLAMLTAAVLAAGCSPMSDMMRSDSKGGSENVTLTGSNEVPPVTSPASGTANITVKSDHTVSGRITVTGMTATAAHIHVGAPGANGPVIVPFVKEGDNT